MEEDNYILTLDNNKEYALVSTLEYAGRTYVYLVELENNANCAFLELVDDKKVRTITNKHLLSKIIREFAKLEGKQWKSMKNMILLRQKATGEKKTLAQKAIAVGKTILGIVGFSIAGLYAALILNRNWGRTSTIISDIGSKLIK